MTYEVTLFIMFTLLQTTTALTNLRTVIAYITNQS